ncbi:nitroreductase [Thiospirochaeta perfilievii]|uniref:Nitroreductase n=1 Tax=Thiospirochaeta perfilievii TaxID=252967 RepID=A0A5C1QH02_9SPIO|nr:nitroreductase family protein [Thiospirochaeta perfilievii]QEN05522.1 nitroreductase [Thiospirochaeta perfilievii]
MAVIDLIKGRSSCRNFSDKSIDESIVNSIVEAGRLAPSAKNRQPWRFIIISEENRKNRLLEACFGADVIKTADKIVAVCTTNINYVMPNGQNAHDMDLSIATSFMMLQAEHEGLGSCIVTTYNEEMIRELLTVPFSMRVYCLLALGYKGDTAEIKKERKSFQDVHNMEHW